MPTQYMRDSNPQAERFQLPILATFRFSVQVELGRYDEVEQLRWKAREAK
jgi:hypothetical protein